MYPNSKEKNYWAGQGMCSVANSNRGKEEEVCILMQQTVPSVSSTVIVSQYVKKEEKNNTRGKRRHSIFSGKTSSLEAGQLLL